MNNLVKLNNGVATTNSVIIAEQFGRKHSHVCSSIEKLKDKYGIVPISYIDNMNRPQIMYELTERQALIAMPFIGGVKSEEGQVMLVDAFLALRECVSKPESSIEQRLSNLERLLIRKQEKIEDYAWTAAETILCIFKSNNRKRTDREIIQSRSRVSPFKKLKGNKSMAIREELRNLVSSGKLKIEDNRYSLVI